MGAPEKEVELSEFIAQILRDARDGVMRAYVSMEEQTEDLIKSLTQAPSELVTEEDVGEFLRENFPLVEKEEVTTAVREGSPYIPPTPEVEEEPPLKKITGYEMQKEDFSFDTKRKSYIFTPNGVKHIREHIRRRLGQKRLAILKRMAEEGIPRVVVETMRVESKLGLRKKNAQNIAKSRIIAELPQYYLREYTFTRPEVLGTIEINYRLEKR